MCCRSRMSGRRCLLPWSISSARRRRPEERPPAAYRGGSGSDVGRAGIFRTEPVSCRGTVRGNGPAVGLLRGSVRSGGVVCAGYVARREAGVPLRKAMREEHGVPEMCPPCTPVPESRLSLIHLDVYKRQNELFGNGQDKRIGRDSHLHRNRRAAPLAGV